jgi:hypothetical protein
MDTGIRLIISLLIITCAITLGAQGEGRFYVEVNKSELNLGDHFQLSFHIENLEGKFEAPDFRDFDILSGPNTSMSMSIMNGEMRRSSSYTYILRPRFSGEFYIEPAVLTGGDLDVETEPIKITILDGNIPLDEKSKSKKRVEAPIPKSDTPAAQDFPSRKKRELKKI